jgi:hypothetical protein
MTKKPLISILLNAVFLSLCSSTIKPVLAHDQEGSLTAAAGESATDLYSINCFNDPEFSGGPSHHLSVSLRNNTKVGGGLSMVVYKKTPTGQISKTATDVIGGDYTQSPEVIIPGGEGDYQVFVHHMTNTAQSYMMSFHCQDAHNQHTGTDIQILQNE